MRTTNANIVGELISIHAQLDAWFDVMDLRSDDHRALQQEVLEFYDTCDSLIKMSQRSESHGLDPVISSDLPENMVDRTRWGREDFRRSFRAQLLTLLHLLDTTGPDDAIDAGQFTAFRLFLLRQTAASSVPKEF